MAGGPRFHHHCRIGNWSEDTSLDEVKLKDFIKKKEAGNLLVNAKQKRLQKSLTPVDLSLCANGVVHFGDAVMLANHQTRCFLSVDPHDKVSKDRDCFTVTASGTVTSVARNVFVMKRANHEDGFGESTELHYGQHFRLATCEALAESETYLHSEPVSPLAAAKISRFQEVVMHPVADGNTIWEVVHPDPKIRFEMKDKEVPANEVLVFRHVATGRFLGSDKLPYLNDYGSEYEVACHSYLSANKTHNCYSELKGSITADYELRRQALPNLWTIFGQDPPAEQEGEGAAQAPEEPVEPQN
uniref:Uncharacterized protein n=1 Tax=Chromera velia CCMP2878 TaxID=1169474 RepID=A0A0G4H371_9ALVE|eukprot:Cvel_24484.t1-p1 / transcript=Cvel_24484.t1 / gene=Cvel_24484 / organism=Chromera_velia_CCMP2878 / gene_product=Uncharacterized protein C15orf26, putative / transcript_product=Uncharacterized protein C15orf26, putative / location=Cvel_scaffold2652:8249-13022(-) / protein_length=299 / sequence_SO=supercontig / SO=protein_coding / is_pseudo=false